jgi:hypothetical protein
VGFGLRQVDKSFVQAHQANREAFGPAPALEAQAPDAPGPEGVGSAAGPPPSPYRGVSVYNTANSNSVADTISAMKARMLFEEPEPESESEPEPEPEFGSGTGKSYVEVE